VKKLLPGEAVDIFLGAFYGFDEGAHEAEHDLRVDLMN
jgi:hypothetical protein